ncbi:uncharacterized protein L201_002091 [Kwoniella dendrophila CBS 6074]|uniref:Uncharacterized protein n=1 Tax=Kwoniella dendrophila CBS 6074 TaxID=1295534 RepID=A0AAX4JP78_9TREE
MNQSTQQASTGTSSQRMASPSKVRDAISNYEGMSPPTSPTSPSIKPPKLSRVDSTASDGRFSLSRTNTNDGASK